MKIDKLLCNKILTNLLDDYPSSMSSLSWSKSVESENDIKKVASQFKYLDEKGLIETAINEDTDQEGNIEYYVQLQKTIITAHGIDFIEDGGFEITTA